MWMAKYEYWDGIGDQSRLPFTIFLVFAPPLAIPRLDTRNSISIPVKHEGSKVLYRCF